MNNVKRPLNQYPGYYMDILGNVFEDDSNEPIPLVIMNGYLTAVLQKDGKTSFKPHHRLFMETWYPVENMENLVVNHLNCIRVDNYPENLEWCTQTQNVHHAGIMGTTTKCVPVTLLNIYTDEEYSFPSCDAAAGYIGEHSDTLLYRLRFNNDTVYTGGWRIKRAEDIWIPINNDNVVIKYGKQQYTCVKNLISGVEYLFNSQKEASSFINICVGVVSMELNSGRQRILPGMWVIKKYGEVWIPIDDIWLKYEQENGASRPVICTYPDGSEMIYENMISCANAIGVGRTTLCYRLQNNLLGPGRNGFSFEYYSDRVRRLGN